MKKIALSALCLTFSALVSLNLGEASSRIHFPDNNPDLWVEFKDADRDPFKDRYELSVHYKNRKIFSFNTLNVADDAGGVSASDIIMHISPRGDRYIAIQGIGRHNDIFTLIHLSKNGHEWIVNSEFSANVRNFGQDCGHYGMQSKVRFQGDNQAVVYFWVGNNEHQACQLRFAFDHNTKQFVRM